MTRSTDATVFLVDWYQTIINPLYFGTCFVCGGSSEGRGLHYLDKPCIQILFSSY